MSSARKLCLSPGESLRLGCAHCRRDSAIITNGMLVWKSPHDGKAHANAVSLHELFEAYMEQADAATVRDLVRKATIKFKV